MKGHEARSTSSCAACKLLKRRCIPNCIFAPYFRSDELRKFAKVHKVFGASNVSKILCEVPEERRADTVNSLAYEAEARLRDPVFGCIGAIALLQRRMVQLQHDLAIARANLARYTTHLHHPPPPSDFLYDQFSHGVASVMPSPADDHRESTSTSSSATATAATSTSNPIINSLELDQQRGLFFDVPVGTLLPLPGSNTSNNYTNALGFVQQHGSFNIPLATNWLPP